MPIGAGGLRLGGGLGALALWGASAPLVSQETRPVGAPLRPLVADPSASTPAAAPALTIPPSCEQMGLGGRSASTGALPEPVGSQLSAAAQQAVTRIQRTSSKAEQRQILLHLSAADRQAVTAQLHNQVARSGGSGSCSQPSPGGCRNRQHLA